MTATVTGCNVRLLRLRTVCATGSSSSVFCKREQCRLKMIPGIELRRSVESQIRDDLLDVRYESYALCSFDHREAS